MDESRPHGQVPESHVHVSLKLREFFRIDGNFGFFLL